MSKKILLSILTIAVAVGLVAVGTGAWFSDTVSSTGNTFAAGTLTLTVGGYDALPHQHFSNLAPGWSDSMKLECVNTGSLDGFLYLDVDKGDPLSDYIDVVVSDGTTDIYTGKLGAMPAYLDLGALSALGAKTFKITYSIDGVGVGNEAQGLSAWADVTFALEQNARP